MNIPADMIEAARMNGANPVRMFFRIKLPYLLSVRTVARHGLYSEHQQLQRYLPVTQDVFV